MKYIKTCLSAVVCLAALGQAGVSLAAGQPYSKEGAMVTVASSADYKVQIDSVHLWGSNADNWYSPGGCTLNEYQNFPVTLSQSGSGIHSEYCGLAPNGYSFYLDLMISEKNYPVSSKCHLGISNTASGFAVVSEQGPGCAYYSHEIAGQGNPVYPRGIMTIQTLPH